jgi:magnesium-transporting ATPase (P-type)
LTFNSFGKNERKLPSTRSFTQIFKSTLFEDDQVKMLLIVATFSFFVSLFSSEPNGWVTGASIYIAVFFMTLISTVCNFGKEN